MLVYRVENKHGEGPYVSGAALLLNSHNCSDSHPVIYRDGVDMYGRDVRCGCVSLEALENWFGEYLPLLRNMGYSVVEYSVLNSKVRVGNSGVQCAFDRHYASKVE